MDTILFLGPLTLACNMPLPERMSERNNLGSLTQIVHKFSVWKKDYSTLTLTKRRQATSTSALELPYWYYLYCNLVRRDGTLFMHHLFSVGFGSISLCIGIGITCDSYCTITVIVSLTMMAYSLYL